MNHYYRFNTLTLGTLLALSQFAQADESKTLDAVQVTGSKFQTSAVQAMASVTVLTRDDIERSQSMDVSDLLSKQVGIDVVRTGGSGSQNSIFVRGGNSNHTLILIDGIRVNSATQGIFDFANLPLANIERIEIVRGPRAAVWGSDALTGVIQIFTRAPSTLSVDMHVGSYQRRGVDVAYGVGDEQNSFGMLAGVERVQGFSSTNPNDVWSFDPDKDGSLNQHIALNGLLTLGSQTLRLTGSASQGDTEFDQGRSFFNNHAWSMNLNGELSERWSHAFTLGQSYEKLDTPDYYNVYGTQRSSADWSNLLRLNAESQLTVGANWSQERGYSTGFAGFDKTRTNRGVFALFNQQLNNQQFELATRFDDNSQFGQHHTSSAGWAWQVNASNRVRASWGQGFRAPNLNELYYPGFFGSYAGNPNLNPERAQTLEIGFTHAFSNSTRLEISALDSKVSDLISFTGFLNQAENIQHAHIQSVEADLNAKTGAWNWRAQGTWTQAINETSNTALLRRPKLKGFLALTYTFDNAFEMGAELSGYSKRPDYATLLPGYARLDFTARWPINVAWRIEARLENIFDRDYQLVNGYNTPGRSFFIKLNYQAK